MAKKISDILDIWENSPSSHTPWGLDGLKKRLSALTKQMGPGVDSDVANANRLATVVKQAVENEIKTADPGYSKAMAEYAEPSGLIRELETSLSLNDKASVDTALRKLQSIMRNNVNTNYGRRMSLGRELENAGATTLLPALAGQALNSWEPRGLARAIASPASALSGFATLVNPSLWPTLPGVVAGYAASSPRLVGETAGLLGKAANKIDTGVSKTPRPVKDVAKASTNRQAARQAGVAAGEAEAMIEDAQGNVYDRKGRLIRRGQQ